MFSGDFAAGGSSLETKNPKVENIGEFKPEHESQTKIVIDGERIPQRTAEVDMNLTSGKEVIVGGVQTFNLTIETTGEMENFTITRDEV